ncbi:iron transporter, partial [Streptomyces sp. NPDC093509]
MSHPDPRLVAHSASVETLLRCWVRETGRPAPCDGVLRIPLPASGTALLVPVRYWSPTGWHRFGLPRLADVSDDAPVVDAVTVAALLTREYPSGGPALSGITPTNPGAATSVGDDGIGLVAGVADSLRRVTTYVSERRTQP